MAPQVKGKKQTNNVASATGGLGKRRRKPKTYTEKQLGLKPLNTVAKPAGVVKRGKVGKVFADERVLYKYVEKHGCINDQWDSENVAVGKWHTAASAKVVGVIDGRKMSTVPDAPAPVPFIPRVTAEISAAESAKDALATAYEEHIAAVAKDPSLAEKTELMLLRAQNAALHAENLRHKEDNSLLRAVASSSHEMTLALKLNSERKTRQKTGHLAIHDAGDAVC